MSSLLSAVKTVIKDLNELNINYAFVGALALGARGRTRQTIDADIAVSIERDGSSEKLIDDLILKGYGVNNIYRNKSSIALARLFAREAKDSLVELDFLFELCGIEKEVVSSAQKLEIWPDCSAPIATVSSLLAMKARCQDLPERIQDKADLITQLIPLANLNEIEEARNLIKLIEERNFNEGRDLLSSFNKLVKEVKN